MDEDDLSTDDEALQIARANAEAHANAHENANADVEASAHADANADVEASAVVVPHAGACTEANQKAESQTEADADAYADANASAGGTAAALPADANANAHGEASADAVPTPVVLLPRCDYSKSVYPTHTAPPAPRSAPRGAGPLDSVRPLTLTRNAHQGHGDPMSDANPGTKVGTDPRGAGVRRSDPYAATSSVAATQHHAHAEKSLKLAVHSRRRTE